MNVSREKFETPEVQEITKLIYDEIGELHHDVWDAIKSGIWIACNKNFEEGYKRAKEDSAEVIADIYKRLNKYESSCCVACDRGNGYCQKLTCYCHANKTPN